MRHRSFSRVLNAGLAVAAAIVMLAASPAQAQQRFRSGDRVECNPTQVQGQWDPGTVVDYTNEDRQLDPRGVQSGRFFRVNLDKLPAFLNPVTCMADFIRPAGGAAANPSGADGNSRGGGGNLPNGAAPPQPRPNAGQAPAPPAGPPGAGGPAPRNLRGTAWRLDSPGSIGTQIFLFCNSGRWEIVGSQLLNGAVSPVGTYTQAGSRLTTRNQDDGMVQNWSLSWPGGDRIIFNDGRVTRQGRYNGRTTC